MSRLSHSQTLKIVVGSEDGLYFEEEVWEEGTRVSQMRFEDIVDADMLFGLLSARLRGFVEGGSAFHEPRTEEEPL